MKADVAVAVLLYLGSSLAAVAVVKALNYGFCFYLAWFLAMTCRSTFFLALPLHVWLQVRHKVWLGHSAKQVLLYMGIGMALSAIEACNMLAMNLLPGSWYTLIKGSDLAFNLVLSRLLLRSQVIVEQMIAILLIFFGVTLSMYFGAPVSDAHAFASQIALRELHISQSQAAWLGLLGSFLSALQTVVTDGYLKHFVKQEQVKMLRARDSQSTTASAKLLLSNAYSMDTTGFSFLFLALPFWLSGEIDQLGTAATTSCDGNQLRPSMQMALVILVMLVSVTRFSERLCKYYICLQESALFFSVTQSFRRMIGVFTLVVLFGEVLSIGICIGTALSISGFALYLRGSFKKSAQRAEPLLTSKGDDACMKMERN